MIMYVVSFEYEKEIYTLCDESGTLVVWRDLKELTKSFRKMYVNMAKRDAPFMVPAHMTFFKFASHPVDMSTFEKDIVSETHEKVECKAKVGTCIGLKCLGPKAAQWRKSGTPLDVDVRKTIQRARKV